MNYGERLASWYLRLNGFIPMPDFVLHRLVPQDTPGNSAAHHADVDLLAVRFPFVHEEIGGQTEDWDREHLQELLSEDRPSAVIVEVKTGDQKPWPDEGRLERSVQRIGLVPRHQANQVAAALMPIRRDRRAAPPQAVHDQRAVIGTLLVCPNAQARTLRRRYTHVISLEHCDQFIQARMAKYRNYKHPGRLFFPDELIQYLAWKAGLEVDT
ncbi:hypothetical protein [Deinococcus aquaedulcis]|uniref:hypothetical protein n=1 Tax=Deinococcus aquaedulcis TaxID=2840455 RepID=UPI001C82F29B|nr:hypothetical protein [Deinococcus aquaedulcis]